MLKFYNTYSRKKEVFKPLKKGQVGLYCCGPTVYDFAHIGNLRTYIFEDILRRVLEYNGYQVKHVENITDVGHLTSDADTGEDKMEQGAERERKTVWQIASYYAKAFKDDLTKLNIEKPHIWCKATDHIQEQIELVKALEKKGYTYVIEDGVYFDTAKLKDYGKLARLNKKGLKAGARVEMVKGKKHPTDFALWKFSPSGVKRQMQWQSPWAPPGSRVHPEGSPRGGKAMGFPGWHLECSAMSLKYLGNAYRGQKFHPQNTQTIDLHCGGVDHIPVHHTNEIAQSEAATGKKFANFWLHGEFLNIDEGKMAKSGENFITLRTLERKGFNPLAFRYLVLGTHYRQKLNFSWESLESAHRGLAQIYGFLYNMFLEDRRLNDQCTGQFIKYLEKQKKNFQTAINNDLNTSQALATMFEIIEKAHHKYNQDREFCRKCLAKFEETLLDFDRIFGFKFKNYLDKGKKAEVPKTVKTLLTRREAMRRKEDFKEADKIRIKVETRGYEIEDTVQGPRIKKILG